ncbi:MAG: hypothetical protein AAB871_00475 [Patescibacteria group bacterium]
MESTIMLISGTSPHHNLGPLQQVLADNSLEGTNLVITLKHAERFFRHSPYDFQTVVAAKEPRLSGGEEKNSATFARLISAFDLFHRLNSDVRLAVVVSNQLTEEERTILVQRDIKYFRHDELDEIAAFCAGKETE